MKKPMMVLLAAAIAAACGQPGAARNTPSSAQEAQAQQPATPPKSGGRTPVKNACELLTPAEIAAVLKVPEVKKDDINSGENVTTHVDICNWYVKQGGADGVEVRLHRAEPADEGAALLAFSAARGDAVENNSARAQQAQPVTGIGDEGIYSPYPDGKGGSMAFRTPAGAVSITGSASRDGLLDMAKRAASRM